MKDKEKAASMIRAMAAASGGVSALAEAIGCSRATVHGWLRGRCYPGEEAREKMASAFGFSPSDFTDPSVSFTAVNVATGEDLPLAGYDDIPREYSQLDAVRKAKVREYIMSLVDGE